MIRILLVDDHKIIVDGLVTLLAKEQDMEVVGTADNGRVAVTQAKALHPDVVIMDMSMPDLNGIEATRQILEVQPDTRIVGLSMHSDRRFVSEMFKVGACGYLLKDCAFDELTRAIRTVISGKMYLSPGVAGVVMSEFVRYLPGGEESVFGVLTSRERQVLQLLAEGKNTKGIALHLNVSIKTVETYRRQIMDKLGTNSVAELTKYAIREGLTSLEK